ncbi:NUDIX domain-containing protein [Candidatus Bathyarchaeota archaeon]|nr:NUDIX domain-containing protein [Candidatus Bathyarchaeota archaeon]
MINEELTLEVESRCISIWKEPWARRSARVTLLIDFDEQIVVVMDISNGFWFLPGGGVEQGESAEETAKREAEEELGLEIEITETVAEFHVNLISAVKEEQLKIPPYIVLLAKPVGGQLRSEYAPNRKILLIDRKNCRSLLQGSVIPSEYECLKPHNHISKEIVRQFIVS